MDRSVGRNSPVPGQVDHRAGDQPDHGRTRGRGDEQPQHVLLRREPRGAGQPRGEDESGDHGLAGVGHAEAEADLGSPVRR